MRIHKKAILPLGFLANGVSCGIKKGQSLDLALFYSGIPAKAACSFTTNKILAAPLQVNKATLRNSKEFSAIIANSGNANCFNGARGLKDAIETANCLAKNLKVSSRNILLASTGIIGKHLPVNKIKSAIPQLIEGLSAKGINKAKVAIMTTDTFAKEISVKLKIGSQRVILCGIAKGAGMISPNMATMLCFIFTDANISQKALLSSLSRAIASSFNSITVDGCMSTNDSILLLANGAAGNSLISQGKNLSLFSQALDLICLSLAKMIVKDAEGATKFIQIRVSEAKSCKEAKSMALSIANSNLFKTAMFGENPNFGRIVAGIGASGVDVKEKDIKIKLSPLNKKDIFVDVSVNRGKYSSTVYTSDLTPEYVKINAEYN